MPPELLNDVVEQWYHPLYRFALSLSRNPDDALDLTQSAFHKLALHFPTIRERSKIKSWLFSVVHREFIDQYRRQTRFPSTTLELVAEPAEEKKALPGTAVDAQSMLVILSGMDEKFRAPLTLFYMESFSYREIAQVMEIPIGTVMSRLRRAKDLLRKKLEEGAHSSNNTIPFQKEAK